MIWRCLYEKLVLLASCILYLHITYVLSCVSGGGGGCCGGAGGVGPLAGGIRRSPTNSDSVPQQTTSGLRGVFGGNIKTEGYVSDSSGDLITIDSDLDCFGPTSTICRWHNDLDDTLEWLRGSGSPNTAMTSNIVGTSVSPSDPFLVLASTPRTPEENGLLVSDPIPCQIGDGELSYRHWLSRSRNPGNEPRLRVCWRPQGELELRDCQTTTNPAPGPSFARIPGPINEPFEIVIEGSGFTNQPEGGVILLDDIDFTADVPAVCDGRTFAVADFPDPRQDAINPDLQYVLESPQVRFPNPVYLSFERYMATEGTLLRLCMNDPNELDCLWESPPLTRGASRAKINLQWREEVVRLPEGSYKLFIVGRYDDGGSFNKGQIGLSYMRLYEDPNTSIPVC